MSELYYVLQQCMFSQRYFHHRFGFPFYLHSTSEARHKTPDLKNTSEYPPPSLFEFVAQADGVVGAGGGLVGGVGAPVQAGAQAGAQAAQIGAQAVQASAQAAQAGAQAAQKKAAGWGQRAGIAAKR